MANETHYRKIENMYLRGAHINTELYETTNMVVSEEHAVITLAVSAKYFHAAGAMHGSVYFKLLDDASFFAVQSLVEDFFVLTTTYNIHMLRPVSSGVIRSEGAVQFKSKNLFVAESKLFSPEGKMVAFGSGEFVKSKIALTPDIGYK
jgi:uncharacterized protein (TIGR00369 family)